MGEDELAAFDALAKHPRLTDLGALTREIAGGAAAAHRLEWKDGARLKARAAELKLTEGDAASDFGNALAVLERGPENERERALASALYAHAVAESPPKGREQEDQAVGEALWLAANTPFDATRLFDRALGEGADELWDALADRVRGTLRGAALGRGEAILGCAALAASSSERARQHAATLASQLKDPVLARVLTPRTREAASEEEHLSGELAAVPQGPALTILLAVTGILLILRGASLFARLALAFRRPAEVTLSEASVRIRSRTVLLGRTLSDRELVFPRSALARAVREVRYPRLGLYVGLLALALGSYFGMSVFVDGVRAASPSLLLTGLLVIAAGVGLDLVLGSLLPGATGKCRVVLMFLRGPAVCVAWVDADRADRALAKLAQPRPAPAR